jgi:hypothetical protein
MNKAQPHTRLWVLLAREAPVAVVFRRGPSRQVQMIKWHLDDDTFEFGQWFKGRVYERRCDLSPSGELLIYFAATYKKPLYSWTAVSKPPWFTALALWPKGDGWNGGGYFTGPREIHLDHFRGGDAPHAEFVSRCRKLHISSLASQLGEDAIVWYMTMGRDGWSFLRSGTWGRYGDTRGYSWKARVPERWHKPHGKLPFTLEMLVDGIGKRDGPWYSTGYRVIRGDNDIVLDLGYIDWADWDYQGHLLFARDGCLYRQRLTKKGNSDEVRLIDLSDRKFEALEAPASATRL